jgi:hypothetical protein
VERGYGQGKRLNIGGRKIVVAKHKKYYLEST